MEILHQRYGGDGGLAIVAVDVRESEDLVKDFVDEYELTFDILLDTTGKISSVYGARSIPTTYLIDRDGTILGLVIGSRKWDTPEVYEVFDEIVGSDG
jgi:peroxiredoxin